MRFGQCYRPFWKDSMQRYVHNRSPLFDRTDDVSPFQIMAYGQTGSGKTFTMGSGAHSEFSTSTGLIPRFLHDIFDNLPEKATLEASFLEVYGDDVHDLLVQDRPCINIREGADGEILFVGLTTKPIASVHEAVQILHDGTLNRTTAATLMNLTSSRSHAIFTVTLKHGAVKSRFTFLDLAGSERLKKTGASGMRAKEGIEINKGLLALGSVINALSESKAHVPYRQSKLTRLLQDALGGNSNTFFLACVSPADTNASETLSTLKYANRARTIENAVVRNVDPAVAEIQKWQNYANLLQNELLAVKFDTNATHSDMEEYLSSLRQRASMETIVESPMSATDGPVSLTAPQFDSPDPNGKSMIVSGDLDILHEANPDEDMAILDELLELQHRDHLFEKEQQKDNEKLKQVEGELAQKEKLLLQLRDSLKVYNNMKSRYESLMAEVNQLEREKSQLAQQLEKARADPTIGCSTTIQKDLDKVTHCLARKRDETRKQKQRVVQAQQEARKLQDMERQIKRLKHERIQLQKKQKEESSRHRQWTEQKSREIIAYQRKERSQTQKVTKLQNQLDIHKRNLDKRQEYCKKLLAQKKTAEAHLMKLVSRRQKKNVGNDDKPKDIADFESKVSETILAAVNQQDYDDAVDMYGESMRLLSKAVRSNDEDELPELQVKVDVAAAEVKRYEALLREKPKLALPTLAQHALDSLLDSELRFHRLQKDMNRKESFVQSLEMEVETLQNTVAALEKAMARSQGNDSVMLMSENDALSSHQLSRLKEENSMLQREKAACEVELAETKERLIVAQVAVEHSDGVNPPEGLLSELQALWNEIGLSSNDRELAQTSMSNCLEGTCARILEDAKQTKASLSKSIDEMHETISDTCRVLGLDSPSFDASGTLNEQLRRLQTQHSHFEPIHQRALLRRKQLVSQVLEFKSLLGKDKIDEILLQLPKSDRLDEEFLEQCEKAVVQLQRNKSKLLSESSKLQDKISGLAKEMNLSNYTDIQALVEDHSRQRGSLPSWWDPRAAKTVAKAVVSGSGVLETTEAFTQHISFFNETLDKITEGRRMVSDVLKGLIERTQNVLLQTVHGELEANQAYMTFCETLFELPPLSKERIRTCFKEIEALETCVEDMTDSEIEALTVVWDALGVGSQEQGRFWNEVDDSIRSIEAQTSSPFDAVHRLQNTEQWLRTEVTEGTKVVSVLEVRLSKLERVHSEVELLRSRQDVKSQIISLDSEVRLLSSKLNDFEDRKCVKQRLTTTKNTSSSLLKEAEFRKQMKSKFTSKLDHLQNLLKSWQDSEGTAFDQGMLSEEVRAYLGKSDRSEFMHLRTTEYKGPVTRKRVTSTSSRKPPLRTKAAAKTDAAKTDDPTDSIATRTRTGKRKQSTLETPSTRPNKKLTPLKESNSSSMPKKRVLLDPFAAVLGEYTTAKMEE